MLATKARESFILDSSVSKQNKFTVATNETRLLFIAASATISLFWLKETGMQAYDKDVNAWAFEQARLLRAGRFDLLDIEHIAGEIEDVGKSEQRELASRMVVLLAHLLKWRYQPERRGASWQKTIKAQRKGVAYALEDSPSLVPKLQEPRWLSQVWDQAVAQAMNETGLDCFPEECPWAIPDEVLAEGWLPD